MAAPELDIPEPRRLVLMAIVLEGGLGLVALGLARWWEVPVEIRWSDAAALLGLAAAVPMLLVAALALAVPWRPLKEMMEIVDRFLAPLFRQCSVLELLVMAVLAGVGEELFFRGLVQQGLAAWLGADRGPWVALVAASALFGVAHLVTWAYGALAALLGLFLGWLWMATGNLLVPIVAHAVYDFFALVYLAKLRRVIAEPPDPLG